MSKSPPAVNVVIPEEPMTIASVPPAVKVIASAPKVTLVFISPVCIISSATLRLLAVTSVLK